MIPSATSTTRGESSTEHHYASLLRKCIELKTLAEGKKLHVQICGSEHRHSSLLNNLLIQLYGKCSLLHEARTIFDTLGQNRNVFSWNIMISAYAQNGHLQEAKLIFDSAPRKTIVSWNCMLTGYAQNGHLQNAKELFQSMPHRETVSWNAMLAAYTQHGHNSHAIDLFRAMDLEGVKPNKVSLVIVSDACSKTGDLNMARIIEQSVKLVLGCETDVRLSTALINMYGKCRSLSDSERILNAFPDRETCVAPWNALLTVYFHNDDPGGATVVFDEMPVKDVISWNIMIVMFGRGGDFKKALYFFVNMDMEGVVPDAVTFANILDSCISIEIGRMIHSSVVERGYASHVVAATAIVDMYGKCGDVGESRRVFERIVDKDVVAYNAMIAAYARNSHAKEAMDVFRNMDLDGVRPNDTTFASTIDACSSVADGELLYTLFLELGREAPGKVANAALTMYGRFGDFESASGIFQRVSMCNDSVPWNAMVGAYAESGHANVALGLLREMLVVGVGPTEVTFINVLVACSRAGLLLEVRDCLSIMCVDFGIVPTSEHLHCVADLLSRLGKLGDARELIDSMNDKAQYPAWTSFVSACGVHGDSGIARDVVDEVVSTAVGSKSGLYACLSRVFHQSATTM